MSNNRPEQDLIDGFLDALKTYTDPNISNTSGQFINKQCSSKKFADVEYISDEGTHWVIEAKTDKTSNKQNEIHKIFGDLLKETGRDNRENCKYAILIPEDSENYFIKGFMSINHQKFIDFGNLVPIDAVFLCGSNNIIKKTWGELHDETSYLLSSPKNKEHLLSAIEGVENNDLIDVDITSL